MGTRATSGNGLAELTARRIRDLRARKRWTQQQLAKKAKVGRKWLSALENAKPAGRPNIVKQQQLADALGVPRDVLFPEHEEAAS